MRSTGDDVTVRLYHLDADSGAATTLCYARLAEAMALAAEQPEAVQDGLFIATDNDVIAYCDLVGG